MCAIAGILDLTAAPETVEAMRQTMGRRGPDDFGVDRAGNRTLLHARLTVIDPIGGRQPMKLRHDGTEYTIVYNGELYNAPELRRELTRLGHSFEGHSDTEVLLHGYAQWGRDVLRRLNGIYAFAVRHDGRVFLARDRIGVKPLFYAEHGGGLLFASEMKTILRYPGFRAAIDVTGAAELLLLGPGRTPGCGVFRGIRELEPGCWGIWEDGRLTLGRYWKLTDGIHEENFADTCAHVRELVEDAIRRQLVSDVPIGCFLSGGLDSSLICSVAAEHLAGQGRRLDTFSVDYDRNREFFVPGTFQPNTDSDFLAPMEEYLGANAHHVILTAADAVVLHHVLQEFHHGGDGGDPAFADQILGHTLDGHFLDLTAGNDGHLQGVGAELNTDHAGCKRCHFINLVSVKMENYGVYCRARL